MAQTWCRATTAVALSSVRRGGLGSSRVAHARMIWCMTPAAAVGLRHKRGLRREGRRREEWVCLLGGRRGYYYGRGGDYDDDDRLPPWFNSHSYQYRFITSGAGKDKKDDESSASSSSSSSSSGGSKGSGADTYKPSKQSRAQIDKSEGVVKLALAGNMVITVAKFMAYMHSGSSAMLSESIHSLVDCGNQGLLLVGIRNASIAPDRHHQYGYGRSIYFWSLVSALGTFWLGAGVSLRNSFQDLMNPTVVLEEITWDVWGVLGISFAIDGSVLYKSVSMLLETKPKDIGLVEYLRKIRDPSTLAVMLEDSGACLGVVMAIIGIGMSQYTGNPMYDSIGGMSISTLLALMGLALARLNERYLLGQAVDAEIVDGIKAMLLARPGIDSVQSVQSQWVGPYTFAYKAEVDFDGTYLAAKLMARYEDEFLGSPNLKDDLPVLLAFYAEDVVRTLEREVRDVEREIRSRYPEAQFIELEPASKDTTAFAIDGHREKLLRELESMTLNQLLVAIATNVVKQKAKSGKQQPGGQNPSSTTAGSSSSSSSSKATTSGGPGPGIDSGNGRKGGGGNAS